MNENIPNNIDAIYEMLEEECIQIEKRISYLKKIKEELFNSKNTLLSMLDLDTDILAEEEIQHIDQNAKNEILNILKQLKLKLIHNYYMLNVFDCYLQENISKKIHLNSIYKLLGFSKKNNIVCILEELINKEENINKYDFSLYFIYGFKQGVISLNQNFKKSKKELEDIYHINNSMPQNIISIFKKNNQREHDFVIKILLNVINFIFNNGVLDDHLSIEEEDLILKIVNNNPFKDENNKLFYLLPIFDIIHKELTFLYNQQEKT